VSAGALERVLARLPSARQRGKEWEALCPAHEDRKASLSVSAGENGKVLLCCHAGCRTEDIVAALGLTMQDLFSDSGRAMRRGPREIADT